MGLQTDPPVALRVAKLGGSLFDLPDLPERLDAWLQSQPPAATLMIVGGGPMVDAVRQLAQAAPYSESFLHWLCIDLLDTSYRLMAERLPNWARVQTAEQLQPWTKSVSADESLRSKHAAEVGRPGCGPVLVRVASFYSAADELVRPVQLPCNWDTTSDALAAWLARLCQADEMVLFKSRDIDPTATLEQWAQAGVVDRAFPEAIRGVCPVRWVNLRQAN